MRLENKVSELNDWIERLLSYTELSKEDMQNLIESEKVKTDIINNLNMFFKFLN